ncbi:MAG: histidinol-phosphatase HisJ family protein [Clostridiales Family XIII bacterium]|jgi:histidinol-phosphatase (PHP family)|nr:histidinol-phosphatase HisJ family protein [Clostridiales Family XIII bacterium]
MYDYHTHTTFSGDAKSSLNENIEAAIRLGLDEIAITDHFEHAYSDPSWYTGLDMPEYTHALDIASVAYSDRIRVVRGIEVGMQPGDVNTEIARIVGSYDFDFVIGSMHSACGIAVDTPLYLDNRDSRATVRDYYLDMLRCLKEFDDFDVLGHINYIDRYTDGIPSDEVYWDIADEVLQLIVSMGKGIEINTRAWGLWGGAHTTPTPRILNRYIELGGETVTTGSDAHNASQVGAYLKEGEDMLRSAGLRYIATFRERKPIYIKLS